MIKVNRKTTESNITVCLDSKGIAENYREKINTSIPFLNHMIEHIAWRCGMGIEVLVILDKFQLSHLICEDVGMTLGKAVLEAVNRSSCAGFGNGISIMDEARALVALSFESRAIFIMDSLIEIPQETEDMNSEDLKTFLEGFAHGALCTMQIDVQRGENGHHIWEAIYRALGIAIGAACHTDETRKGKTSGVAGKINYLVE